MDIVDTFSHLIPTEQLDDALFLGSNLENEVCEDFSASQNVLEDSLKNMLSDKDPMLGSASAQFCLPVLDSNGPNFQMPCSTVISLDDTMDEEGVKESGNDTLDDDELVLPHRNLRSRAEETSVTSPRKSPRLMAQESVRSLRQSTLAKRSNVAPPVSTKKSSVKGGSAPKSGQKRERSPVKETDVAAPSKVEQPKEVRRSTRRLGQVEGTAAVTASQSNTKCLPGPEDVNEVKSETLHQAKVQETSQELSCANFTGACSPSGETKEIAEVAAKTESGNDEPVCSVSADTEMTPVKNESNDVIDSMDLGNSSEEKAADNKAEESEKKTEEHDEIGATGKANDPSSTCLNPSEICDTFSDLSSSIKEGVDCSLGSHNVEVLDENTLSVKKCVTETGDDDKGVEKTVTPSEKLLDSTEFDNKDLKSKELTSADPGNSILESTVLDQTNQNVQHQISSIKVEDPEALKFQDDEKQISISTKCEKNIRPRHSKSVIQNKQNLTADTRQKSGTVQQEVMRSRTRAGVTASGLHSPSSAGLKRNADEQESHQHPNNPVKIRKKQSDLSLKAKSCVSGMTIKKQSNTLLKKIPRVQASGQAQKSSVQRASEKSPTLQSCSKDTHHSGHSLSGHVSSLGQKQAHGQKHQLATGLKTNSSTKEETETKDHPVVEHLKEDDKEKNKSKRNDKTLQPRQRRSSKSLSLDEPPLFIPDNISTVRREGLEHTSASESKHVWVPSKQCGFCKKPHGNRFMVGCGRCDDWFHGDCVGLSLSQAQQMGEEDKEYVCVKCCAEEDKKMECFDQSVPDTPVKLEHREEKAIECEKLGMSKQTPACNLNTTTEKTKQMEDTGKHKVKIFRRESGDGKNLSESRDLDTKKGQHVTARKGPQTGVIPRRSPEDKNEKISKESLSMTERSTKSGVHEKQEIKKRKNEKGSISATHLPAVPASKPSADQIRQSVKQSLKEILMKRLTDSSLKIPEERAAKVATRIERELFSFFRDTDAKYKNKYRSLMFNLKDPKNNILFKKVLKGEVTPDHLIKMSPEELASKELAAWRQRENRHTIEMIEKEQREVERRPITKITHKGEIEIESETPMKEQEEVMEIQEPNMKLFEKSDEAEKDKEINESASPDTTSQHKNHLFDLNCKICIGRMAPPTDDLSAKKVKVSVGVARKQSDNEAESIADALSSTSSILASELLEDDKQDSSKSFTPLPKSETPGTVECESLFLARLNFIWKGFINMPSVAKFVIKAYPVSGSFEYLTEDLPDSIQVGGRISPHTVWDYVEKIKASGTKEICVVRFTPVTEEDQISYALLFAYFSSRKRYGVAANNMKQVKDLYLIPLGSSDKVPHHLVPFDGPGIEIHRPNLLLGLIIRQKMKRQITAVSSVTSSFADEAAESTLSSIPPEKKSKPSKPEVSHHELALEEEENNFFNSFTTVLHKQRNKLQQSNTEDVPAVVEPLVESTKHEPPKPLRFLPGVLVGWENQPSALELANKPLPVDDILQSLLGTTGQVYEHSKSEAGPSEEIPLLNEQATLKEENMDVADITTEVSEAKTGLDDLQESTNTAVTVDTAAAGTSSSAKSAGSLIGLSLKGKPPDVSTEAFLANLSAQSQNKETEEGKENDPKLQVPDKDNVSQEVKRSTNSNFSSSSNAGKKPNENNVSVGSAEGTTASTSKSPPFINLKRDPRQAAGRSQQTNTSENKDGDVSRSEDRQNPSGNDQIEPENKQSSGEVSLNLYQSDLQTNESQFSSAAAKADSTVASQAEDNKHSQEDALMQNIETVNSFRRGPAATSSHFETENSSRSEFISKVPSPVTSGSFSSVGPPQQNFQHPKANPPGFQFQAPAPHNFPQQNNPMFGFPPHLPPPLLPPPGFGFPQNPMMPWPPVAHLSGQPPHYAGPIAQGLPVAHKQSRFLGPENFFQSKDSRRPERRHSNPWGREEQHLERGFSRGKNDRQRLYSETHHQKKERHEKEWSNEKYWEQDSERNRRRDRNQEKERERKSREEGQRDKERVRSPHSDRAADGKSPRETRNPEKKTEKPKSEEQAHEKDKEREKSKEKHRERDSEKNRERHRDHSDRTKSKR
ncbi:PHD finger protein 3 isoform X1 [Chiroxiphia lanceolata]|uniref:PHD finger protein 3 isoform X1 n=2 Tax=Chiroxiphia lanceolata TaxID=296741 RepID=UPI0013CED080|nr:PHD finger protein 3 isoform X1 [Chiroxiphia lanceolata]XP_032539094.1 PHD finger protein 3 isoform X1 [Chiroxiphia lanceolata]